MTLVGPPPEASSAGPDDALARPFTPGMADNDPALAAYAETVAAPVEVELADARTAEFVSEWRNASYNCFSSGHKFCREVCPVVQVSRNESWAPTAFHANVVAMERGELGVADVAADYVNCTQCGACELRCPNTLFTGDFYRFRTRTVDVVKAVRALAVESGVHQPGWRSWNARTDERSHEPVLVDTPVGQETVRDWAAGLDLPVGGETVLFVDCEAAFHRTSVPRAVAQILRRAGVEFGLMGEQWCCGGPAAEMGYVEQARRFARHNLDDWRATGTRRLLVLDPHDYIAFTEDYPKYFGAEFDIEVVLVVELLAQLLRAGRLTPTVPVRRTITYHDPCRLNKRKGVWQEPREVLRAIPGLTFHDVDRVTQWSYCSGGGGGLPVEKPELTAAISARRLDQAAELEVDTLVSACPWSERPLAAAGAERAIDVVDIHELLAESLGIEVGGHRDGPHPGGGPR
ncbi:MAG TPA: (Fe-S)-binding protein [Mycobacteriales bacterium]|nr:(Fe-S)-binding protein [Mycobacteriales bacterium]